MRIKLLFDQNLSYKLCKRQEDLFPESSHIRMLNLEQANNGKIWDHAKKDGFTKSVTPVVLRTPSVTLFVSYCSLSNASKK